MSEAGTSTPDISVVLEWENALWADQQLGAQVLGALRQQFESLERPAELILQFNHAQVDPDSMRSLVDTWLGSDLALDVRLEPADDLRYYELKNAGARLARGAQWPHRELAGPLGGCVGTGLLTGGIALCRRSRPRCSDGWLRRPPRRLPRVASDCRNAPTFGYSHEGGATGAERA